MTSERPDPLARLDAATDAVTGLRDIAATEEPLDAVLARIAVTAVRALADADAVSISVLTRDGPRTVACTDPTVLDIDARQYAADRGPCLESARSHHLVRAVVGEHDEQWPEFTAAAKEARVRAYLSVPLLVDGADPDEQELLGSLNVYSYTGGGFDSFDESLMRLYSTTAAEAIRNANRWQQFRDQVNHLEIALTSRAEIDQAKGILMAIHGYTAEEAFAELVRQSQRRNIKLHQLARDLIDAIRTRPGQSGRRDRST